MGASTLVTLQASENDETAMVPELVCETLLVHLPVSVSVTGEPGLVVTFSVKVRVCRLVS